MNNRCNVLVPAFFLLTLALFAFGPIFTSHPLMDDHLFFAWLEETPWGEAIRDRLTGNWIPYFNQLQMYRPVSGVIQVATYHLFGTWWLPYHLFSFLMHLLASLMAGLLSFRLTQSRKAGWFSGGLLLLHPRAALGASLIYNFYDPLVACLMMAALLCLRSLKQAHRSENSWVLIGLWACVALALGSKELALPLVLVLILADWLWKGEMAGARSFAIRHGIPVMLLVAYLLARTWFIGHPVRTHGHASAFPLPPRAEAWAFAWDGILLSFCSISAWVVGRSHKWRAALPAEFSWMILWSGLMLLPAVHFCSQVTLRPWFFDERYWYVPLVPLSVLTGSLLSRGNRICSLLGVGLLALTLPSPLGIFLAAMIFLASGPLQLFHRDQEVQRLVATSFAAVLAILLWGQCGGIRLRADEAANVHQQIARVVQETPANAPVALLNFTEETVEPRQSFNGDLQWMLRPPFFPEDLNKRIFFAYPTWDAPPPTNRFRDRMTREVLGQTGRKEPIHVYFWETNKKELSFVERRLVVPQNHDGEGEKLAVKMRLMSGEGGVARWVSDGLDVDPRIYNSLAVKFLLKAPFSLHGGSKITLGWVGKSSSFRNEQNLQLSLDELNQRRLALPVQMTWEFPVGNYMDWLVSERISELSITTPESLEVLSVELRVPLDGSWLPENVLTHYQYPDRKFLRLGESSLVFGR